MNSAERGLNVLPGRRTFTDDDVLQVIGEALTIFERCEAEHTLTDIQRPLIFQAIVNMIGHREVPQALPAMAIPRNLGG